MPEMGFLDAVKQKWNSGGTDAPYKPQPASVTPEQSAQYAQAAFGTPPDAPFVPAETQPLQVAYQQAQAQPQQAQPQFIAVPEQTVQTKVASPQAQKAEKEAQQATTLAFAAEQEAAKKEDEVRQIAYGKVQGDIEKARTEFDSAAKELEGRKVIDPMDKWGTGKQIGAAIAMGLGAFAASYSGGKNHAAEIINNSIQRDIDMQEREINRLGKNVDSKKNALAQAYNRLGDMAQAKDVVYQAALAGVSKDVESLAASAKSDRVKANALALQASVKSKMAESAQRVNETVVTNTTRAVAAGTGVEKPKPMTEAQGKAYAYVESMKQAEPILAGLEQYGATVSGAAAQKLPQFAMPAKAKQLAQAQEAFAEGYIRFASGANVPKSEIDSTIRRAMPAPGDSPKELEQKRQYRAQLIRSMEVVSRGEQPSQQQGSNLKNQLGFSK